MLEGADTPTLRVSARVSFRASGATIGPTAEDPDALSVRDPLSCPIRRGRSRGRRASKAAPRLLGRTSAFPRALRATLGHQHRSGISDRPMNNAAARSGDVTTAAIAPIGSSWSSCRWGVHSVPTTPMKRPVGRSNSAHSRCSGGSPLSWPSTTFTTASTHHEKATAIRSQSPHRTLRGHQRAPRSNVMPSFGSLTSRGFARSCTSGLRSRDAGRPLPRGGIRAL